MLLHLYSTANLYWICERVWIDQELGIKNLFVLLPDLLLWPQANLLKFLFSQKKIKNGDIIFVLYDYCHPWFPKGGRFLISSLTMIWSGIGLMAFQGWGAKERLRMLIILRTKALRIGIVYHSPCFQGLLLRAICKLSPGASQTSWMETLQNICLEILEPDIYSTYNCVVLIGENLSAWRHCTLLVIMANLPKTFGSMHELIKQLITEQWVMSRLESRSRGLQYSPIITQHVHTGIPERAWVNWLLWKKLALSDTMGQVLNVLLHHELSLSSGEPAIETIGNQGAN